MLDGQFTRLRSVDLTDAEWMRRLRTSPVVMQAFQYRYPITDVQQEEFIRGLSANREQLYFVAEDPAGAKPFGVCCLHEIDYRNQRTECGIFWDADATGGEIAAFEAGFLLRDYAYSYLNLQKIVAEILSDNVRVDPFSRSPRDDARGDAPAPSLLRRPVPRPLALRAISRRFLRSADSSRSNVSGGKISQTTPRPLSYHARSREWRLVSCDWFETPAQTRLSNQFSFARHAAAPRRQQPLHTGPQTGDGRCSGARGVAPATDT